MAPRGQRVYDENSVTARRTASGGTTFSEESRMTSDAKLAIDGGKPVRTDPVPARKVITQQEIDAVMNVLKGAMASDVGTMERYGSPEVDEFEREWAAFYGVKFATAVTSGTAALHTAVMSLQLDVGQEIIVPTVTDPGAVAAVLLSNCVPVFADVEPETMNIDPAAIERVISDKTRAIFATHLIGQPCDLDRILAIGKKHGIVIIEDCAQAHGARWHGKLVGSHGDIGCWSLMSGKHINMAGQGGMVATNNEHIYWNAKRFADRGKPFNVPNAGGNVSLGINYRVTSIQAAMGRVQLQKTDMIADGRRQIVARIGEGIKDLKAIALPKVIDGASPSWWFMLLRIYPDRLTVDKPRFVAALRAEGVSANVEYRPIVPKQPWIRDRKTYGNSQCPWSCPCYGREISYDDTCAGAELAADYHITVPIHEEMDAGYVDDLIEALCKVERACQKA